MCRDFFVGVKLGYFGPTMLSGSSIVEIILQHTEWPVTEQQQQLARVNYELSEPPPVYGRVIITCPTKPSLKCLTDITNELYRE